MNKRFGIILAIFTLFFSIFNLVQAKNIALPAPTILGVDIKAGRLSKPLIKGVTFNDTIVDVYIDNQFFGQAAVANDSSGVASFAYMPDKDLSFGQHKVYTIAKSSDGNKESKKSEVVNFIIPYPTPAPILLEPVADQAGKVAIVGLAKNNLEVEIYIEGVLQVRFTPPPAKNGTTNFWYKPGFSAGEYTVIARAIDSTGKASVFSKSVVMRIPKQGEILAKNTENKETNKEEQQAQDLNREEVNTEAEKDISGIKQSDEFTEKTVEELEKKLPEKTAVVKNKPDNTKVVVGGENNKEEGVVKIKEPERIGEIVLDTSGEDMVITTETTTNKEVVKSQNNNEETITFGKQKSDIGDGVSEEVDKTSTTDEIQQKNHLTGFVILLIIAVILAVWYVREKKQIEMLEKGEKNKEKSSKDDD